jgi:hypothetical protein
MNILLHDPPVRYTYPSRYRILAWAGMVVFALAGALSALAGSIAVSGLCAFGCAICAGVIVIGSESISTDDEGLMYRRLWRTDLFLAWAEITALRAQDLDASVRLVDSTHGRSIFLNARLQGYSDLINRLLRRRPDLFRRRSFQLKGVIRFGSLALILFFAILALSSLGEGKLDSLMGFSVMSAVMAWIYLSRPLAVELMPDGLRLRIGFVRRLIPLKDILTVRLKAEQNRRTSRSPAVEVILHGGKTVELSGFAGGEAFLYCSLQLWLEERAAARLA